MDFEAYADAQCALLGITLTAEQRPGVIRYLQLVGSLAPRVMDFALTPADEPAPRFEPVATRIEPVAPRLT